MAVYIEKEAELYPLRVKWEDCSETISVTELSDLKPKLSRLLHRASLWVKRK